MEQRLGNFTKLKFTIGSLGHTYFLAKALRKYNP